MHQFVLRWLQQLISSMSWSALGIVRISFFFQLENGELTLISSELPWRLVSGSCLRGLCPLMLLSLWLAVYLVSCLSKPLVFGLQARGVLCFENILSNNRSNWALFRYLPTFLPVDSFLHGNIQLDLQVSPWLAALFSCLLCFPTLKNSCVWVRPSPTPCLCVSLLEVDILSSCAKQGLQS